MERSMKIRENLLKLKHLKYIKLSVTKPHTDGLYRLQDTCNSIVRGLYPPPRLKLNPSSQKIN